MSIHSDDALLLTLGDPPRRSIPKPEPTLRPIAAHATDTASLNRSRLWVKPLGWLLIAAMYGLAFALRHSDRIRQKPDWLDDY